MEIIHGFAAAKARLARQIVMDFGKVSPHSKELFGREMSPQEVVEMVLQDVKTKGDAAVIDYTQKFDGYTIASFEVSQKEIKAAYKKVDSQVVEAIKLAAQRIREFHQEQKAKNGAS